MAYDPIQALLSIVRAEIPRLPTATLLRIERQARAQLGGERVYVQKGTRAGDSVAEHYSDGISAAELAARAGCSRRTAYRWMARLRA